MVNAPSPLQMGLFNFMNKEKKYKLLREVLNATTGHIIPVGEIFKQYKDTRKYYSSNGWLMSEDSCLKKDWFEEVVDKDVYIKLPSGTVDFLNIYGNCVKDNESTYYNLPFWYKVIKDDTVIMYTEKQFNELPASKLFEELVNKNPLTKERLQEIFEVKSDSTQGALTPQNWKQEEEVPLLQKGYKILSTRYNNKQSCEEGIQSVRRLSDNTIWTVGDAVGIGGYKTWTIVKIIETEGEIFADLEWSKGCSFTDTTCILKELKKI